MLYLVKFEATEAGAPTTREQAIELLPDVVRETSRGTSESYCGTETDPGAAIMACTGGNWKSAFVHALPALVFLAAVVGAAAAWGDAARDVGPKEAQALIRKNVGNRDFVVLDVRTPGEFAQGHLEGAVLVDYRSPGFREEVAGLDKTKTYLVYCRTGNRSASALGIMREFGFRSHYHLEGGIVRWLEEGLPEVR
jgi:rhodanese-related sulfurtransferase